MIPANVSSIMPRSYRPLFVPAPFVSLPSRELSRFNLYVPRFDSSTNRCWWERYQTRAEQENDGWVSVTSRATTSSGTDDVTEDASNETDELGGGAGGAGGVGGNAEGNIVIVDGGEEGDTAYWEENVAAAPPRRRARWSDEYEQALEDAWNRLHAENERRDRLATRWHEMHAPVQRVYKNITIQ